MLKKHNRTTHGKHGTPEYRTWSSMKCRCENKNDKNYFRYGAVGIKVCKRWKKFENFYKDMGLRPSPKDTIDRIESTKGYYPKNCRWATVKEQNNNRKSNRHFIINGVKKNLSQWAEVHGIKSKTVSARLEYGWGIEKALNTPVITTPQTHCRKGHPFDLKNTIIDKKGVRKCKPCHLARQRAYRLENLEKYRAKARNQWRKKHGKNVA